MVLVANRFGAGRSHRRLLLEAALLRRNFMQGAACSCVVGGVESPRSGGFLGYPRNQVRTAMDQQSVTKHPAVMEATAARFSTLR